MTLGRKACLTSHRLLKLRCALITAAAVSVLPGLSLAGDYATCLLEKLPGVQNDAASYAAVQVCLRENPGGFEKGVQGSGRGFFSYDSGAECTLDKAKDTASRQAGYLIGAACRQLYDEPWGLDDELLFDPATARPVAPTPKPGQ